MKKITTQQIADELGISRNTVSKVINNKNVSPKNKKLVINKLKDLGYKGFESESDKKKSYKILLLSGKPILNIDFFVSFLKGIENYIFNENIELFQYIINPNLSFVYLSEYIKKLGIDGIIGIEIYNENFLKQLLDLKCPIVFIDAVTDIINFKGSYDVVLMESRNIILDITSKMLKKGRYKISYCGDYHHCLGFYERYLGMRDAFSNLNLRLNKDNLLLFPDNSPIYDLEWFSNKIKNLKVLPEVIICANDSIAVHLINALKYINIRVPDDIQVIGFDNSVESSVSNPTITTIDVNKELFGEEALNTLLDRIKNPNKLNKIIHIKTNLIIRESTILL